MDATTIHNEFRSVLSGYIRKRVRNAADAEDLLQDVFLKIHSGLPGVSSNQNIRSWIFTITRNAIIDHYRRSGSKPLMVDEQYADLHAVEDEDSTKGLENCIRHFISRLPEEYRDVVVDSEIRGISQKVLSEKYGIAYSSLRSRVQRGRARLKEMFLNCCRVELDSRGSILSAGPCRKMC